MIRIATDTSADLPRSVVEDLAITEVPLTIRFGETEYVDRRDLSVEEFWVKLPLAAELPQTAAPSVGAFEEAYRSLAMDGADGVVAVCLSAALSGTLQAAELGARSLAGELPVRAVDSRVVSGALGLSVMAAARVAAAGGDLDAVTAAAASASARANVFGALDTLEYLKKGGRIGAAQAFFGELLNVKPLITLDEGVVAPGGRVRTRKKALTALLDHASEVAADTEEMLVVHSEAPDLDTFTARLAERFDANRTWTAPLGPVVGTHAGPGVIGVCYRLR